MRERTVWLGTPGDVVQVKCPSSGLTKTPTSWNTSGTYLSGGGFARSSGVTHQEYAISWGGDSVENFATLLTQLSKQEPIYYLDPLECKTNLLPPYVAQYVRGNPLKSSPVNTGTGVNGYPNTASSYQYDTQVFTTPVPEGFRLWVGAHGTGGLSVTGGAAPEGPRIVRRNLFPGYGALQARNAALNVTPNAVSVSPNAATYDSSATLNVPSGGLLYGGVSATITLAQPQTSQDPAGRSRSIVAYNPETRSAQPDNVGGSSQISLTWQNLESPQQLRFYNGANLNGGDVVWSDIFVVGGNSAQEVQDALSRGPFTGDTPSVVLPGGDVLEYGWEGTPGESVSFERLVPHGNTVTALPPSSNVRVNASFPGGTTYTLTVLGGSLLSGTIAQILPEGETPTTGGFLPGMGHSMLSLNGDVSITEYSAVLENYQMALTANFIETGTWGY